MSTMFQSIIDPNLQSRRGFNIFTSGKATLLLRPDTPYLYENYLVYNQKGSTTVQYSPEHK
jgi:hypothetical protein